MPHIEASGVSHPGRVRPENEDSIFIDKKGNFMLLADGMGGHEFGAEASQTALEVIRNNFREKALFRKLSDDSKNPNAPLDITYYSLAVIDAVTEANGTLFDRNKKADVQRYMGTTLVGLITIPKNKYVLWFHVGDSRLYRWRDSVLKSLTIDHSAYVKWLQNGKVGKKPGKNIITRAIGTRQTVSTDVGWDKQLKNDTFILCSDGLTDMVSNDQITEILSSEKNVTTISQQLLEAANDAGGRDNVSVVVCKIV